MPITLPTFPRSLMRDRRWTPEIVAKTMSGGKTLSGVMPLTRVDGGGIWLLTMSDVQASSPDNVWAWRALEAMLDGGSTAMIVPMREERFFPAPTGPAGVPLLSNDTTCTDDVACSDDTPWEGSCVEATLNAGAAVRATSVQILLTAGAALRGGELFSIRHDTHLDRTYRVSKITAISGSVYTCDIRPPLREAVAAGKWLEFDYPACVMQLAEPNAMRLVLERRVYGDGSIVWLEAFPPFSP